MKPGIGVGVMILDGEKVLLGLRNPNKIKEVTELQEQGTWTMPGGKVEFMEQLHEAAIREAKEETNLDVFNLKMITVTNDITDTAHYVTIGFVCESFKGDIKVMEPETIIEWKWFNINDLPKNLYSPSKKLIELYLSGSNYE